MEVFRDLTVQGLTQAKLVRFIQELGKVLPQAWERDRSIERGLRATAGTSAPQYVYKARARDRKPAVRVFLFHSDKQNTLSISNIVPETIGQLSHAQYNQVVEDWQHFLQKIAQDVDVKVIMTTNRREVTELLSPRAMRALMQFSVGANKSTGFAHPADRARWLRFLVIAHQEKSNLDSTTLWRWLVDDERWPETEAQDLASYYDFAVDLLNENAKSRS